SAVGQRHVLRLGHLHRDRLELPEVRRAAQLAPARADAVEHARGVAGADLAHLDPRAELAGEVTHEFAEIDALLAAEVDGHAALARRHLDVHHLHGQTTRAREAPAGDDGRLLAPSLVAILGVLVLGGAAGPAGV